MLINDNIKGIALTILSSLFFSFSMSLVKGLDSNMPTTMVVFIRNCIVLLCLIPLIIKQRGSLFRTRKLLLHSTRIVLMSLAMLSTYSAYRYLPLSTASAIGMTGPLFTTVLSALILKEQIYRRQWALIFLGYLGVILVLRPASIALEPMMIVAILANVLAAFSMIAAKTLLKEDSPLTLSLYSGIGITVILGLSNLKSWPPIAATDLISLLIIGLLGSGSQFSFAFALKYANVSTIAPFEYVRMVFATIIGISIFAESVDNLTIIGSLVIIGATSLLTYSENKT